MQVFKGYLGTSKLQKTNSRCSTSIYAPAVNYCASLCASGGTYSFPTYLYKLSLPL